ncbi:hypothetical protein GGI07_003160 [Coemansia sp. Benny D115]|nr:hypothetical protein GGI07_003160 [Coemansia sp. Benny D115]
MLDHILGKPSANVRRAQVLLTALLTLVLLRRQKRAPWGLGWLMRLDRRVPVWKALLGWSTVLYVLRHMDDLLGLNAPEPLREYYSRSFYRATWIFTALDAGFWTAMSVRPRFLRHMLGLVFSLYYLVCTNRAVEKVRKVRALITVDHLRVSWNKGVDNPVLRFVRKMHSSKLSVSRAIYIPARHSDEATAHANANGAGSGSEDGSSSSSSSRPSSSDARLSEVAHLEPAKCHIMYTGDPASYRSCRHIVLNFPGGGFVAMGPECHSDYLSAWAEKTGAIVVSVDYAKAPEYPYPYAIDQCYEVYREIVQTAGACIGLDPAASDEPLRVVMAGDSAGGNITASVMFRILESADQLPVPAGIVFIYGCFNVDIRAWMTRRETRMLMGAPESVPLDTTGTMASQESLSSLVDNRDHLHHISPLAVTNRDDGYQRQYPSTVSAAASISAAAEATRCVRDGESGNAAGDSEKGSSGGGGGGIGQRAAKHQLYVDERVRVVRKPRVSSGKHGNSRSSSSNSRKGNNDKKESDDGDDDDGDSDDGVDGATMEKNASGTSPSSSSSSSSSSEDDGGSISSTSSIGYVPLSMTSSFTYFNDQILSPEMMRAMIIMYIGPNGRPNFRTDYYLSPLVAPDHLLELFPPVYFMCGEKDPMVDDTVLFAARIRKAKQRAADRSRGNKESSQNKQQQQQQKAKKSRANKKDASSSPSSSSPSSHAPASLDAAVVGKGPNEYRDYRSTILYSRRHSQPRLRSRSKSGPNFFIGSTDVSDNDDETSSASGRSDAWAKRGGGTNNSNNSNNGAQHQHLQLPASLRMSHIPAPQQPPSSQSYPSSSLPAEENSIGIGVDDVQSSPPAVIKVKLVAGMSHGFMQMYSLLPESKRVADTMAGWLAELLYGDHQITAYSRCASLVDHPTGPTRLPQQQQQRQQKTVVDPTSAGESDYDDYYDHRNSGANGYSTVNDGADDDAATWELSRSVGRHMVGRGGGIGSRGRYRKIVKMKEDPATTANGISITITSPPPPPVSASSPSPSPLLSRSESPSLETSRLADRERRRLDKNGIEIVSSADMLRRRGHGLADPLN